MSEVKYWKFDDSGGQRRLIFPNWSAIKLSAKQAEFFFNDYRKEIVMAGRGFGKDYISLLKKVNYAFKRYFERREGNDPEFIGRAGLLWHLGIMAAESGNYKDNINKLRTMLPKIPGIGVGGQPNFYYNRKEEYFELFGEGQLRISLISLFGDGGQRGPGYDDCLVTEAQAITEDKYMSVVVPMVFRPGYEGRMTLIGTGLCNWFDNAVEEARNGTGFYGDYKLFCGTSFDNPKLTLEGARDLLREYEKNPGRFKRERLGLPNIIVTDNAKPDCPFTEGLVSACLTKDRITLNGPPLVIIDLAYGGSDKICRGVWNKETASLFRLDYFTSDELKIDIKNPYGAIAKFFEDTARLFPGCTIAYDCQGQYGGSVQAYVPRHIKLVPMRRNRQEKNNMVEDVITRMALVDAMGKSIGIRLPDPNSPHLDAATKKWMPKLLKDLYHLRKVTVQNARGDYSYYYTKGEGYEDDGPDMISWSMSQLNPMNKRPIKINPAQVNRSLVLG